MDIPSKLSILAFGSVTISMKLLRLYLVYLDYTVQFSSFSDVWSSWVKSVFLKLHMMSLGICDVTILVLEIAYDKTSSGTL